MAPPSCVQNVEKSTGNLVPVPIVTSQNAPAQTSTKLNVWHLTGICYFAVAGGPFGFEETIGSGGSTWAYVGMIIIPLIWSIPIALMAAELATYIPDVGGQVVWVERGMGPTLGFANSLIAVGTTFTDNAIYPVMISDYLGKMLGKDLPSVTSAVVKSTVVIFCAVLNIRGVDVLGDATVTFGILIILPFVVMSGFGIFATAKGPVVPPNPIRWGSFLSSIMWCTSGFDSAGTCICDVQDAAKTFPRAVAMTVILVIATYVIPLPGAMKVIPLASEWEDGTWSTAARLLAGPWLAISVSVAAMLSNLGILSTMMCTTSRQLVSIADSGRLPFSKFLSKEHPVHKTSYVMIICNSIISLACTNMSFKGLAQVSTIFYSTSTMLRFISLWRLRMIEPDGERAFKIPGGHFGMALVCVPPICLSAFAASQVDKVEMITSLSGMAIICIITAAHSLYMRFLSTESAEEGVYVTLDEIEESPDKSTIPPINIELRQHSAKIAILPLAASSSTALLQASSKDSAERPCDTTSGETRPDM